MSGSQTRVAHAGTTSKAGLRADIEGLRGIAVGTVLAYHLGLSFLPGGFAGVDIFFVISGFLITSLLIREAARSGRISITAFYARRARRLLPAACVVLVVTGIVGYLVLPVSRHHDLATDVIAATLYVVNWALAGRAVDYLAEGAGVSPLQHYWSLSVEEQYYVIWPLLMIAGLWLAVRWVRGHGDEHDGRSRALARRIQLATVALVAVASFAYSVVQTANDPAAAYFVSTTRVWELAVGSLLAFAVNRLRTVTAAWLGLVGWAGLAMIAVTVVVFSAKSAWPGWAAGVPVLGAAALIACGCSERSYAASRVLAFGPLVWLGGISYSLYLWHWPVLVLAEAKFGKAGVLQTLAAALVSLGLAWLSKHYVEDPIRFSTLVARPSRALLAGGLAMCLAVGVGSAVGASVPSLDTGAVVRGATALVADPAARDWKIVTDPQRFYTRTGTLAPLPGLAAEDSPRYYRDRCQVPKGDATVHADCAYAAKDSATTLALLGDSKMGQWFAATEAIARREKWQLRLYLKSACSFSFGGVAPDCARYAHAVIADAKQRGAPAYALISQGSRPTPALERGMGQAVAALRALGTQVVLLADTPVPKGRAAYTCVEQASDYRTCASSRPGHVVGIGTPALAALGDQQRVPLLDLNPWICPPGPTCPVAVAGTLVYRQGSHVTDSYVRTLTPMLHRALVGLGIGRTPPARITLAEVPASTLG